jgi:hypothetical protein
LCFLAFLFFFFFFSPPPPPAISAPPLELSPSGVRFRIGFANGAMLGVVEGVLGFGREKRLNEPRPRSGSATAGGVGGGSGAAAVDEEEVEEEGWSVTDEVADRVAVDGGAEDGFEDVGRGSVG